MKSVNDQIEEVPETLKGTERMVNRRDGRLLNFERIRKNIDEFK